MAQVDLIIILPLLIGFLPILFVHYTIAVNLGILGFLSVRKLRTKLTMSKLTLIKNLN